MNSKHICFAAFFFIPAVLLCLSGCTPTEMENTEDSTSISFSAYTGVQTHTRSVETKLDNMKTDGFGIIAYMTNDDYATATTKHLFMENQMVKYATSPGSGWTYTPTKYWPNNGVDKLTFFAYAPYDADASKGITVINDNGTPKITLSAASPKATPDLVVANESTQMNLTSGTVTFPFKHTLARVRMLAKTAKEVKPTKMKVCVSKIELIHSSKVLKTATLDMTTGIWTPANDYLTDTYDLEAPEKEISSTVINLFGDNQELFFIPVTTIADDIKIKISYNFTTLHEGNEGYTSTTTKTISLNDNCLDQNKSYTYTFTIGLDDITMDTSIESYIPIENDDNTMVIATAADLVEFRDRVNGVGSYAATGANPTLNGVQVEDIDMNEAAENSTSWVPIKDFAGTYNGNGRKIKNLRLIGNNLGTETNIGLFANTTSSSLLTGICIENGTLQIATDRKHYGALLAGSTEGVVSYCSVAGCLTMPSLNIAIRKTIQNSYWAGLIRKVNANSIVTYCKADFYMSGGDGGINSGVNKISSYASGFVGENEGVIASCFSKTTGDFSYIELRSGGFAINNSGQIYGCYAKGKLSNRVYYVDLGGFTLENAGTIASCYSKMDLAIRAVGGSISSAGGFVRKYNSGSITNCFSNTSFSGSDGTKNYGGGFVCYTSVSPVIKNCFCTSTFSGNFNPQFYHFSYNNITQVENCYTTGTPASGGANGGITIDESLTTAPAGTQPLDWTPSSPVTIKTTQANPDTHHYPTKIVEMTISSGADLWEATLGADGYPRIKGVE